MRSSTFIPQDRESGGSRTVQRPTMCKLLRILVVDDDEAVRNFVAMVLDLAGFQVLQAQNGDDAIRIAEHEETIHLVLTDVVMPGPRGRHLANQIASLQPGTRVLLMSGYPNLSGLLNGITGRTEHLTDDYEFIQKPFSPSEIVEKVRSMLAQPHQNQT